LTAASECDDVRKRKRKRKRKRRGEKVVDRKGRVGGCCGGWQNEWKAYK